MAIFALVVCLFSWPWMQVWGTEIAPEASSSPEQTYEEDGSDAISDHNQESTEPETITAPAEDSAPSEPQEPKPEPSPSAPRDEGAKILTIRALDKISANVKTMKIRLGEMASFGRLRIVALYCKKSKPSEAPETTAFLRIYEQIPSQKEMQQLFSGWMFASSPTASALSHPVYDVWVTSCTSLNARKKEAAAVVVVTPTVETHSVNPEEGGEE